jgi:hypothetical protein
MTYTDAEKQLRFRKKEALKRKADQLFGQLQISIKFHAQAKSPRELRQALDKAIELPSGWSDADLANAYQKLAYIEFDMSTMPDQIKNDLDEGTNSSARFMAASDPNGFQKEERAALEKTRLLASHITSALNLSNYSEAEKAAAVMEAVRSVGRDVANMREVPRSSATAICMACVGPHYKRPKWFAKRLAHYLRYQIDRDSLKELAERLSKPESFNDYKDEMYL